MPHYLIPEPPVGRDPMSFDELKQAAPYAEKLQFDATYPSSGGLNSHIKSPISPVFAAAGLCSRLQHKGKHNYIGDAS